MCVCSTSFNCIAHYDGYYEAVENENCPKGEVITTEDDCKKASTSLGKKYQLTLSSNDKPAGCYSYSWFSRSWFNEITDIDLTTPHNGAMGLCMKGKTDVQCSFIDAPIV